ncbi:hypothetical protein ABIB80_007169 [Bradyrhizobium sp. i1.15.2]|uniref:hypothetical protein n=1 Tax=Bradyrhizobium sp. i1.15.2 TaxID=3156362 RepID=UPI003398904E
MSDFYEIDFLPVHTSKSGEPMSPLEAIVSWLEKQDSEMQEEIAGLTAFLLFESDDVLLTGGPEQLKTLKQWLSEPNLSPYRAVGRAFASGPALNILAKVDSSTRVGNSRRTCSVRPSPKLHVIPTPKQLGSL